MSETNFRAIQTAVASHLVALSRIIADLHDIEIQMKEETLFPHLELDVAGVRHTLRLSTRVLGDLHVEYGLHADSQEPSGPDALGGVKVIDQPVSPAPIEENP